MKCAYSENEVALYVEGDLAPAEASQMGAHLLSCGICRELVVELRESQTMLKSLRQDTVSGSALSSVRTRVLAEVASVGPRPVWGRWIYAMAGSVFVMVIMAGVVSYTPTPKQVEQVVKSTPLSPALTVPLTRETVTTSPEQAKVSAPRRERDRVSVKQRRQEVAHTEMPPDSPKPLVVKLLTDDPNVVIYWLVDQKNGGTL